MRIISGPHSSAMGRMIFSIAYVKSASPMGGVGGEEEGGGEGEGRGSLYNYWCLIVFARKKVKKMLELAAQK
jgi:hypothetical protein